MKPSVFGLIRTNLAGQLVTNPNVIMGGRYIPVSRYCHHLNYCQSFSPNLSDSSTAFDYMMGI